jgi:hypothetical protein
MIRRTDKGHVEFGVEGAEVINQPISDLMFQVGENSCPPKEQYPKSLSISRAT